MKKLVLLLIIALLSSLLYGCQLYDATKTIIDIASTTEIDAHGTIDGYVYTNELLGMDYRIDSSWGYYDGEEMYTALGISPEDLVENAFYDMFATDTYRRSNLSVYFSPIDDAQLDYPFTDAYLDLYLTESIKSIEDLGCKMIASEITTVEIDGKELDAINLTYDYNGLNWYGSRIIIKRGNYLAFISVHTYGTDTTADILDNFSWLD